MGRRLSLMMLMMMMFYGHFCAHDRLNGLSYEFDDDDVDDH